MMNRPMPNNPLAGVPMQMLNRLRQNPADVLKEMGFDIEASHHEAACGQQEIDFKYSDALTAADNIMTFKYAVKAVCSHNGYHATFMPKPILGINGSGMHCNISLFKDGVNLFYDAKKNYQHLLKNI